MPFDNLRLKPRITVLPTTTPPERGGGGPQRVHIEIEIVDRRQPPPRRYRFGTFTLWLIVLLVIAALAHGQPAPGQRYEHWQDTNDWHGQIRTEGRTTVWDSYGPRGEQKHCHRYYVGDQPYTNCH
jgi:hypothetical protein